MVAPPLARTDVGGVAVAAGQPVDDATVHVEDVDRRLRKNPAKSTLKAASEASGEVRTSIASATGNARLVVMPPFARSGLGGRVFALSGPGGPRTAGRVLDRQPVLASFRLAGGVAAVKCDAVPPRGSKWRDAELPHLPWPTPAAWAAAEYAPPAGDPAEHPRRNSRTALCCGVSKMLDAVPTKPDRFRGRMRRPFQFQKRACGSDSSDSLGRSRTTSPWCSARPRRRTWCLAGSWSSQSRSRCSSRAGPGARRHRDQGPGFRAGGARPTDRAEGHARRV